ncbi:hypothetical protein N8654_02185 [Synechococcus sp. AH-601-B19]|nr:hypothetical protein [Synechococcus sp. AH-601-B19]
MNFKALAASALVAIAGFGFAPESKAADCSYFTGYQFCYEFDGRNADDDQLWNVTFRNNYTTEHMRIACDGKYLAAWESRGGLNKAEARNIAALFCSL